MLRTRLWMGGLLILLAAGTLVFDPAPWFPLLFVLGITASGVACYELIGLLPSPKPRRWVVHLALGGLIAANWPAHVWNVGSETQWILGAVAACLIFVFLVEGACFREAGSSVIRISLTFLALGYLGLLASFLIQLRWFPEGVWALAMAVFVPKAGDIGAYFTGRLIGKHRMTPALSPKKTWEGAAGGLAASVGVSIGLVELASWAQSTVLLGVAAAMLFGLAVGVLAQLGDLMESLIKRDGERKDASALVPGFGGVLDVLDSILFSAPLSYALLVWAVPN